MTPKVFPRSPRPITDTARSSPTEARFTRPTGATRLASLIARIFLIILADVLIYRHILFPPSAIGLYPWASDTLGHVLKAQYLQHNLAVGNLYPDLFPSWYMGVQMLRYYPPLPYFLLVALTSLAGNSVVASSWFVALCALLGGLAWLPYQRWVGQPLATIGGVLFLFLPDNVRVALAEGNLPRVLATAVLPLAVYLLLRSLEGSGARRHSAGLSLCFAVIVLCHAMMGAIYAVCCGLLVMFCLISRFTTIRRAFLAIVSMILGIMLSGWWLLPSLTDGITSLNATAVAAAVTIVPLADHLNPFIRLSSPETLYVSAALLLFSLAALFIRVGRTRQSVALTLTGMTGVGITLPGVNELFNALPMHHLFWPERFLGCASFMLLLALLWRFQVRSARAYLLVGVLLLVVAADAAGSLSLIHLRPARSDVMAVSKELVARPGWREATLDDSRLGSAASYFFTALGKREQLYGWAYQGAYTAPNVAALNQAMELGFGAYMRDRLTMLGADDVVLFKAMAAAPLLSNQLVSGGFQLAYDGSSTSLYHRDGGPRAYVAAWPALGIGQGAQNLAYLFPQLVVGTSPRVDDYTIEELQRYQTVVLSGFSWRDEAAAETLVTTAAAAGVRMIVDLSGTTEDPLARIPHFLNVWGEPVFLKPTPTAIESDGQVVTLQGFGRMTGLWHTLTPQGMEQTTHTFDYLGERAAVLGYNSYGTGRVSFVGLNLPYYAATSQDPVAIALLAEILGLPANTPSDYTAVALSDYRADANGYQFVYRLAAPARLLVPIAAPDGIEISIDGTPVSSSSIERLLTFDAPAGEHRVVVRIHTTSIYLAGKIVSPLALLGIIGIAASTRRRRIGSPSDGDAALAVQDPQIHPPDQHLSLR